MRSAWARAVRPAGSSTATALRRMNGEPAQIQFKLTDGGRGGDRRGS